MSCDVGEVTQRFENEQNYLPATNVVKTQTRFEGTSDRVKKN